MIISTSGRLAERVPALVPGLLLYAYGGYADVFRGSYAGGVYEGCVYPGVVYEEGLPPALLFVTGVPHTPQKASPGSTHAPQLLQITFSSLSAFSLVL
jgi:hypothetical protein